MSTPTLATSARRGTGGGAARTGVVDGTRRRALLMTTAITVAALALLGDLVVVNHTNGKEIWGLVTAAGGVLAGLLSLAYLALRARSRLPRILLYALWATVAVLGLLGLNSHRLPVTADSVDQRPRPPLAPLVFTGLGVAGAVILRSGSKNPKGS